MDREAGLGVESLFRFGDGERGLPCIKEATLFGEP